MFSSPPIKKQRIEESSFDKICRLAREQDLVELNKVKKEDWKFLRLMQQGRSVMQQMAMNGDHEAIAFLAKNFKYEYDQEDLIQGYAEVGLTAKVAEVTAAYEWHRSFELQDHQTNHPHQKFIWKSLAAAASGYAAGGHDAELEKLLNKHPECLHAAANACLESQRWSKLQELTARGGKVLKNKIPKEIYRNEELFLRVFACINDAGLRAELLADMTAKRNEYDDDRDKRYDKYRSMAAKAANLSRLMRAYHVDFEQALKLYDLREKNELVGVRTWLMQGKQVTLERPWNAVKDPETDEEDDSSEKIIPLPILPNELYFLISRYLLNLSDKQITDVMHGLQVNLFETVQADNTRKYTSGLFSAPRYVVKVAEAVASREERMQLLR